MKRQSFLCLVVIVTAVAEVSLSFAQPLSEVTWHGGVFPPSWYWVINPSHPSPSDIISFSGPTQGFSNACFGSMSMGGTPTLTIDGVCRTVELWFRPPKPDFCITVYIPVCGLEGRFGPLPPGQWLFFSNHPQTYFQIPFTVSGPSISVLSPNGGEFIPAGSRYKIAWQDSESQNCLGRRYLLDYSTDNGQTWVPAEPNSVSDACWCNWLVPSVDSNDCLVRVIETGSTLSDTSDRPFSIYHCRRPTPHDLDLSCYVDFRDFALLADLWMAEGGTAAADLAAFVEDWCSCGNPYDPACGQ